MSDIYWTSWKITSKHYKRKYFRRCYKKGLIGIAACLLLTSVMGQKHFFTVRHDNDFLNLAGQGTDRYYTSGIYFQYSFVNPHDSKLLNTLLVAPHSDSPSFYSVGLIQWMYTPDAIQMDSIEKNDYPYCGVLFLDLSRENKITDRTLFRSELYLGMIGPAALARQAQQLVHHIIKGAMPEGWAHQIPDYPVINYNLYAESNLLSVSPAIKVNGLASLQVGTLLNTFSMGLDFLISNEKNDYFPDRFYTWRKNNKIRLYAQLLPLLKFTAYNSILQGGPFDGRHFYHIDAGSLQRVLFEGTAVFGIQTRKASVSYRQVIESGAFRSVHYHVYGCIALTFSI